MNKKRIAQELVTVAMELTAIDSYERAHNMLMSYEGVVREIQRAVDELEDELKHASRTEAGLQRVGGGKIEAIQLLKGAFKKALLLEDSVSGVVRAMKEVLK